MNKKIAVDGVLIAYSAIKIIAISLLIRNFQNPS